MVEANQELTGVEADLAELKTLLSRATREYPKKVLNTEIDQLQKRVTTLKAE